MLFVALSVVAVWMTVERLVAFAIAGRQDRNFHSAAADALYHGCPQDLPRIISCFRDSPLAAIVGSCVQHDPVSIVDDWPREQMIVAKTELLKQRLWCLKAFEFSIPTVGFHICLLIAVETLRVTQEAEGSSIAAVAGGLAEAVWPLILAAAVTLFLAWPRRYLQARLESFVLEMDRLSPALIQRWVESRCTRVGLSPPNGEYRGSACR
jgi:hypothetical protein